MQGMEIMLDDLFLSVLNMNLFASYVIVYKYNESEKATVQF